MTERPEIISPLGNALYAQPPAADTPKLEIEFAEALAAYESDPHDLDKIIMYGRRMAYLWRYHESIVIYTEGLKEFPESAMLYRHRGHRYISIRRFEAAERDLARADQLQGGNFDILYHLGLSRWLQGDFEGALAPYRGSLQAAGSDEHRIAAAYWLYFTLRRTGRKAEAEEHLRTFQAEDKGESEHYFDVLLLLKGDRSEDELRNVMAAADYVLATVGYGTGLWHLLSGREAEANSYFERVLRAEYWPAFGYIASEVETLRAWRTAK